MINKSELTLLTVTYIFRRKFTNFLKITVRVRSAKETRRTNKQWKI